MARQTKSSAIWRLTCEKNLASVSAHICRACSGHLSRHDYAGRAIQLAVLLPRRNLDATFRPDSSDFSSRRSPSSLSDSLRWRAHNSHKLLARIERQSDYGNDSNGHDCCNRLLSYASDLHHVRERRGDTADSHDSWDCQMSVQDCERNFRLQHNSHSHADNLDD